MNKYLTAFKRAAIAAGAGLGAVAPALATPAIDNDTLEGMPDVGSDIGSFLQNLAPGVGVFVLILGIFGGIVAIVYAIVKVVIRMAGRKH